MATVFFLLSSEQTTTKTLNIPFSACHMGAICAPGMMLRMALIYRTLMIFAEFSVTLRM